MTYWGEEIELLMESASSSPLVRVNAIQYIIYIHVTSHMRGKRERDCDSTAKTQCKANDSLKHRYVQQGPMATSHRSSRGPGQSLLMQTHYLLLTVNMGMVT